ncbi:hypothetical protein SAMN05216203_1200 [Marinobacter daqiaonensis]|uniref:Uncharacterized protein n=1 Tax=Marinobacter daqiaonensis TaxID=650891 RepID=A0A1I6HFK6_9GAMM|nr:hypothetical protein [Marinobacter daqiaonensis]SFR53276.1 hypothetical protein SAMN05216203_1200 [Marinobacter daqiaonensis]
MSPGNGADPRAGHQLFDLFDLYNRRYFHRTLRPSEGFGLRYTQSGRQLGRFRYCPESHRDEGIDLAARLQDHPRALRSAMVREMIPMLGLQRYRETGDTTFLDRSPLYGHLFIEPGIGAFFLAQMEHLNVSFPELCLTIKPRFGSGSLFEQNRIPSARLMIVWVDNLRDRGVIYRLHDRATTDWPQLQDTAERFHGTRHISVLRVAGALAEQYAMLKKDNLPRSRAKSPELEDFALTVREIQDHRLTAEVPPVQRNLSQQSVSEQLSRWTPEAYSGY